MMLFNALQNEKIQSELATLTSNNNLVRKDWIKNSNNKISKTEWR